MDANQKIQLKLLVELTMMCESANIPCYLANRSALAAYLHQEMATPHSIPAVLIPVEKALTFAKVVERKMPRGRALDSMLTNDLFPSFTMRYVDNETLFFYVRQSRNFVAHGMFVCVQFVAHVPDEASRKRAKRLRISWYDNACPFQRKDAPAKQPTPLPAPSRKARVAELLGVTTAGKRTFKELVKLYSSGTTSYCTVGTDMTQKSLGGRWSSEMRGQPVTIDGQKLYLPPDPEAYLQKAYGANYASKADRDPSLGLFRIQSPMVSCEEFVNESSELLAVDTLDSTVREVNRYNRASDASLKATDDIWRQAMAVGEGLALAQRYENERQQLVNLYENRSIEELRVRLQPYLEAAAIAEKRDVSPFCTEELSLLCEEVLHLLGEQEKLEEWRHAVNP